jgi:hypothetical protein
MLELRKEQLHIQEEQLRLNKMLLDINQNAGLKTPSFDNQNSLNLSGNLHLSNMNSLNLKSQNVFKSWPLSNIIDDLVDEGIISDKENLELIMDNKILKVNGVVQPEELHEKLKGKYLKSEKSHVIFSRHGDSMSGDINNG